MHAAAGPPRREDCGCNLLPHSVPYGLIKGLQSKVVYQLQSGTTAHSGEFGLHSALRTWGENWAPVIVVAQIEHISLLNHQKEKWNPTFPLPTGARNIRQIG